MNKHGQTLILFIILIPLVIMLIAVVVDTGLVISKKAQLQEVTKMVIKDIIDEENKESKAGELFVKNDINIENLEIIENGNKLQIKNELAVESIFGSIIGIKTYDIKIDIVGQKINEKIVFE